MQSYGSFYLVLVFNFILQFTKENAGINSNKKDCREMIMHFSQSLS